MVVEEGKFYKARDDEEDVMHIMGVVKSIMIGSAPVAEFARTGEVTTIFWEYDDSLLEDATKEEFVEVAKKYGMSLDGLFEH